jgi:BMFP domain-containing protein YqiC
MSKSRFVLDKFAKLIEQGLLSYKDLSDEIVSILKSKRDEIVFRMKLTSKEEFDILNKRVSNLEKKLNEAKKRKNLKKTKRVKKF